MLVIICTCSKQFPMHVMRLRCINICRWRCEENEDSKVFELLKPRARSSAPEQLVKQVELLPGKLEGYNRVLPIIANDRSTMRQIFPDGWISSNNIDLLLPRNPPLCTGEENKWSWHSGADLLPLKSRWKIIPLCTASKWRFVWLVFTRVLCLTRNLKGIHLFREFVTTQPKICCLRSNHSPTTGWRLPDQALNQRASPWQTQSNAFPPLSHSSSAPLLNKSSLRNCIWGNQREGHLAHSAPSFRF